MMSQVTNYFDIKAKVATLGCNMPSGVTVLPQNIQSAKLKNEICYENLDLELRDAFRQNGIIGTSLEESEEDAIQVRLRESAFIEWIPPIIFISSQLLQENPSLIDLVLNIVSNFLYDKFKTVLSRELTTTDVVEVDFIKLSLGDFLTYKRARYRGYWKNKKLTGLKEFGDIVRKM